MRSDGEIVIGGLFALPNEALAGHLALLQEATLARLIKVKALEKFSESGKDFAAFVQEAACRLMSIPGDELALWILGQLNELLLAEQH